jgi:predicted metal-dependent hydrolase
LQVGPVPADWNIGRQAPGDCSRCYDARVQLRLPWTAPAPRARVIEAGGRVFPVQITRHRLARRYILRVTASGVVRVTVPRGASVTGGLAFAAGQADWITAEWTRRHARAEWTCGTRVWYRGEQHAIACNGATLTCGASVVANAAPGDIRAAFHERWRAEAAAELPARCTALGAPHGLRPVRVQVRNQQSRWGSCSTRGSIALNWRLVQMPDEVADYVMLHELVHLEHPNHSTRFWRRVAVVCPGWRSAERWLRTSGRDLL